MWNAVLHLRLTVQRDADILTATAGDLCSILLTLSVDDAAVSAEERQLDINEQKKTLWSCRGFHSCPFLLLTGLRP